MGACVPVDLLRSACSLKHIGASRDVPADPHQVPLPTLGGFLEKEGVYDMTYVPK